MGQPPEPAAPDEMDRLRGKVSDRFKQLAQLFSAIASPLPTTTGDGTSYKDSHPGTPPGLLATFQNFGFDDVGTVLDAAKNQFDGEPWDDKKLLMEHLIKAASDLGTGSSISCKVTEGLLSKLYSDLQHPPQSYLDKKYKYRQPDGSHNSLLYPQLGAANTSYARTVKPMTFQRGVLPDAEVIFDSLMARDKPKQHENKISSVLFYLASIIIHDIFRTDINNRTISLTSSYLDLAPLYGSNDEEQQRMRTLKDGKLRADCFSEVRILGFPPGVGCLLIMFNRFHNFVVDNLALINEGGRFTKPRNTTDTSAWKNYDENLFQTGRLITCGLYVNIILIDYVRTILNLNRTNSDWQLNPRLEIPSGPPLGQGNQVSAEFNLVYRWHSAVSDRDERWTKDLYRELFGDSDDMTMHEFLNTLREWESKVPADPQQRDFAHLKRTPCGLYEDDDLVEIIASSVEDCANAFGPRSVPKVLKLVEVLGINQAREWNLSTLNEFRQHFNLTPYKTFQDMTPDEDVAATLKDLYDQPDLVELYPGLVAENTKPAVLPGSGLMPSNTVSRAILADAVALVRGDRFYTLDYHPKQLTNWGFAEVSSDLTVNHGCVFYKLFLKAFPNHFKENSVYAHFPMTIPQEMRTILSKLPTTDDGSAMRDSLFEFAPPSRTKDTIEVKSYNIVKSILEDKATFNVTWGPAMEFLMGPEAKTFMLAGDRPVNAHSRSVMRTALYTSNWHKDVRHYYETKTQEILDEKKYILAGKYQVDIVRDVSNLVHVHFCSDLFALPLKTKQHPHGIFTEHEMYLIMAAVFTAVFFDLDPEHSFQLRQISKQATQQLGTLVQANVEAIKLTGYFSSIMQYFASRDSLLKDYGIRMIKQLLQQDMDVKNLVWGNIMGTAGGMVANQGQLFAQALDYFFSDGIVHVPRMRELALANNDDADEKLMHYILEGSRLYCGSAVFRDVARDATVGEGVDAQHFKKGDRLFLNFYAASRDPSAFPEPDELKLDRPLESYIQFGWGPHQCLGIDMTRVALTAVLKVVMRLPGLQPAKGQQGKIQKVPSQTSGYWQYLTEAFDGYFPFPTSLKVTWNKE